MNIVVKENYKLCALIQDRYGAYHAIIYRKRTEDYVFCWNYNVTNGTWGQGHYVTTFESAVAVMKEVLVPDVYFKGEAV